MAHLRSSSIPRLIRIRIGHRHGQDPLRRDHRQRRFHVRLQLGSVSFLFTLYSFICAPPDSRAGNSHSATGVLPLSRRLASEKRSKAGTRVCRHSVGQSVSPLIIADMARCLTTHTGIQSDIKGIARLRAYAYLIAVLGDTLQLAVFRHTARGVFHLSFHQMLLSNLKWSSLKSNHQRGLRRLWVRIHKYQIDIVQILVSGRCTLPPHKWRSMAPRSLNSLPNLHKRLQNSLVGTRLAF